MAHGGLRVSRGQPRVRVARATHYFMKTTMYSHSNHLSKSWPKPPVTLVNIMACQSGYTAVFCAARGPVGRRPSGLPTRDRIA